MKIHQVRYALILLALTLFAVTLVVNSQEAATVQSDGEPNSPGQFFREIAPFENSEHRTGNGTTEPGTRT